MTVNDPTLLRTSGATLSGFGITNIPGTKTVLTVAWCRSNETGTLALELTAEQCADLSIRLFDQAKALIMERHAPPYPP